MTLNDAIAAAVQKYMDRYSSLPISGGIWSAMRYIVEEVLLLVSRDTLPIDVGAAIDHIIEVGKLVFVTIKLDKKSFVQVYSAQDLEVVVQSEHTVNLTVKKI